MNIWSSFFDLEKIGIYDDFFDLGGHSLLIARLMLNIKDFFIFDLPLHDFLEHSTIYHLAQLIDKNDLHKTSNSKVMKMLLKDRNILVHYKIDNLKSAYFPPKAIFLTGATGFLGAHLLYNLYYYTAAKIYCLVKSSTVEHAKTRIISVLKKYQLGLSCYDRIIPVIGDLTLPHLGMSTSYFLTLASEIDTIYHNGAHVHHLYGYDALRNANVLSTIEILKFATLKKLKVLHYISTLSAASFHQDENGYIIENFIGEATSPAPEDGYSQTKWVSEHLLRKAHQQGVPIKIYRPGWILGQSKTGILSANTNHLLLLIKGCIQMGFAPNWEMKLDILPVDFISEAITKISLSHEITDSVF